MKAYTEQSDRQRQSAIDGIQKRKERRLNEDVSLCMSTPAGRRLMYWLIWSECGINDGIADAGIKDGITAAMHSWRREGQRDIGMNLVEILKRVCLDKYVLMIQESTTELQKELLLDVQPEEIES
jgi:citrate lyase alpha subunit